MKRPCTVATNRDHPACYCGQISLESLSGMDRPRLITASGVDAGLVVPGDARTHPAPTGLDPAASEEAVEIFFSYSHKDKALRDRLETHLANLKQRGVISGWHDRRITAGSEWKDAIDEHLESSRIILLLVSANFLSSEYCYNIEMKRAMERHERGEARVIPVIFRPCDWHTAPFGKLQSLPEDGKPVCEWNPRDKAFLEIVNGIRKVVAELT